MEGHAQVSRTELRRLLRLGGYPAEVIEEMWNDPGVVPSAATGRAQRTRDDAPYPRRVVRLRTADRERAADHLTAGQHHAGVLIALSSRFSCRPAGRGALVAAVLAAATEPLEDRVVYLQPADRE